MLIQYVSHVVLYFLMCSLWCMSLLIQTQHFLHVSMYSWHLYVRFQSTKFISTTPEWCNTNLLLLFFFSRKVFLSNSFPLLLHSQWNSAQMFHIKSHPVTFRLISLCILIEIPTYDVVSFFSLVVETSADTNVNNYQSMHRIVQLLNLQEMYFINYKQYINPSLRQSHTQ